MFGCFIQFVSQYQLFFGHIIQIVVDNNFYSVVQSRLWLIQFVFGCTVQIMWLMPTCIRSHHPDCDWYHLVPGRTIQIVLDINFYSIVKSRLWLIPTRIWLCHQDCSWYIERFGAFLKTKLCVDHSLKNMKRKLLFHAFYSKFNVM